MRLDLRASAAGFLGAAVVLHRGAIYWLSMLLGDGVVSALGVTRV